MNEYKDVPRYGGITHCPRCDRKLRIWVKDGDVHFGGGDVAYINCECEYNQEAQADYLEESVRRLLDKLHPKFNQRGF